MARTSSQSTVELKWLTILFIETVLLLVFQVTAGFVAGSLALLADSGHAFADVISYGINFISERQKVVAAGRSGEGGGFLSDAFSLDLLGSGCSTLLLGVATWFASVEAIERLRGGQPHGTQDLAAEAATARRFDGLGPALLSFAVVSTVVNLGTLVLFRTWRTASSESGISAGARLELAAPKTASPLPGTAVGAPEQQTLSDPGLPPPGRPVPVGKSPGSPEDVEFNIDMLVCSPCGSPEKVMQDSSKPVCGACTAGGDSWTALVHGIVHPGCPGVHVPFEGEKADPGLDENADPGLPTSEAPRSGSSSSSANLNVTSAVLHLVADVLRGITILAAALLIEFGSVTEPGKVDAVCALAVSFFIGLGSVELVRRLGLAVWRRRSWKPIKELPPKGTP